jgi:hypothetical protein
MNNEFWITASISDLVFYPDEWDDKYVTHPNFQAILNELGIAVPVEEIHEHYFSNPVHTGDMLVFRNQEQPSECIVLNAYRDPLDQLDMIQFGWSTVDRGETIRQLSRHFYDECEYAVRYEEGQSVLYHILRKGPYSRIFHYNTVFEQQLKSYDL